MKHYKLIIVTTMILFLSGCSFFKSPEVSKQQEKINELYKLTKTVEIVQRYYIEKKELYQLVNIIINGILSELKNDIDNKLKNSLQDEYGKNSNTKSELLFKLTKVIELVENNTKHTSKETVSISLKVVMDSLDTYSIYINNNNNIKIKSNQKSVKIKSFYSEIIDNKYLYLKVETFDKEVVTNLKYEINNAKKSLKGIILDLRDNTGGLLSQAISTVDLFVSSGIILSQRGRGMQNVITYKARDTNVLSKLPLVILVDKISASSSEIVSGSLQDLERATVIGEKTFGKGTIQVIIPITKDKKEAIRLTIARYFLPKERSIDNKVIPDIEILQDKDSHTKGDIQLNSAINFLNSSSLDK